MISQKVIRDMFDSECIIPIGKVVDFQKRSIEEVFAGYEGYLGVDMIVEGDGSLRPFVEVNVRRTMGMIQIIE